MKQSLFTIQSNEQLAEGVYKMVLAGDTSAITAPGQFVNIRLNSFFLRRPISVCDYGKNSLTIIYKTVGKGTEAMRRMKAPHKLDILTGLGNGYNPAPSGERPLLVGGGAGVPPMYALAKKLLAEGKRPIVILGFNRKEEMFYTAEFEALGTEVHIATADGSFGTKGFVTDVVTALPDYTYFYACGPEPMLKVLSACTKTSGQLSFEERMGCGFGACMGCSCQTKYGSKRICKDGPVLEKEEILW